MKKAQRKILFGILITISIGILFFAFSLNKTKPVQILEGEKDCVILLHGLARSSSSMESLAEFLNSKGFKTVNIDYPSTKNDIETLSKLYLEPAIKHCGNDKKINFVSHSLGGIIIRNFLAKTDVKNLGKVVMIAPPNNGSEIADILKNFKITKWFFGPALAQLGTDNESFTRKLPIPTYDVLVIAGNSPQLILSEIIPGEDDGKVSVENTKIQNSDFLLIESSHTFIMDDPNVKKAIVEYF